MNLSTWRIAGCDKKQPTEPHERKIERHAETMPDSPLMDFSLSSSPKNLSSWRASRCKSRSHASKRDAWAFTSHTPFMCIAILAGLQVPGWPHWPRQHSRRNAMNEQKLDCVVGVPLRTSARSKWPLHHGRSTDRRCIKAALQISNYHCRNVYVAG